MEFSKSLTGEILGVRFRLHRFLYGLILHTVIMLLQCTAYKISGNIRQLAGVLCSPLKAMIGLHNGKRASDVVLYTMISKNPPAHSIQNGNDFLS